MREPATQALSRDLAELQRRALDAEAEAAALRRQLEEIGAYLSQR